MANGDNGGLVGGTPQPQQQIPMHQFNCATPECGTVISGRAPIPQVFNLATVSGLVISHERITRCPKCGAPYICMIAGLDPAGVLQLVWTPIAAKPASQIAQPTGQEIEAVTKLKM